MLLALPSGASPDLHEVIDAINFLMNVTEGTDFEVSGDGKPAIIWRTEADSIVVSYKGDDPTFTTELAAAITQAGYEPQKLHCHGVHFNL